MPCKKPSRKLLKATQKYYGKKKGKQIAYAITRKRSKSKR
jgi:hypothetical protein